MKATTATREQTACLLIAERFNATELAEALQTTRQSALAIMQRIDRSRLRKRLSMASAASASTDRDLPTLPAITRCGG